MKKNTTKAATESHARFVLNGSYIFMLVSCKDSRLKYSTGKKIDPKGWDSDNQQVKPNYPKATNKHLSTLAEIVDSYFDSRANINKAVLKDDLRRELLAKEGREEKIIIEKGNFFTGADSIVKMAKNGDLKYGKKDNRYKAGTIRNWEKTIATLQRFSKDLCFESISLETYRHFRNWAEMQSTGSKKAPKFYSQNYIDALIKDWKSILEVAKGRGFHSNNIHNHPDFKRIGEKPIKIDLTDAEIELLKKVRLSGNHAIIRDRFIMNLYLGFRISDLEKLTIDNIKTIENTEYIVIPYTDKTGSRAQLPLVDEVKEIMRKYNGKFPRQFHRNIVNTEIKAIARWAGITGIEEIREIRGGIEIKGEEAKKKRCDLISNHTGRRTAITSYLTMGVKVEDLAEAMGVSVKTILTIYDGRKKEEHSKNMSNAILAAKGTLRVA